MTRVVQQLGYEPVKMTTKQTNATLDKVFWGWADGSLPRGGCSNVDKEAI